ncbi:hypothetical protein [Sphingomonas sp.]|uniref:hypothetical protein n=1 Tax=Sphingomonas sp. TaxID=28214 RepID=UPI002E36B270|nr:hypothetical protein [Sphingomonas sp.]HEX4693319.1 hypothetical protein [Sphingomonas sp.]
MTAADQELQRNIRAGLFGSIAELADIDYQRATWLDPEMQNPHYGYVEFVECFYDSSGGSYDETDPTAVHAPLRHWIETKVLSQVEADSIWPLHLALKACRPKDPYALDVILDDAAWQVVVATAYKAKEGLIPIVKSPEELGYFENCLPDATGKRWP